MPDLTYTASGVNYAGLDAFKREAQRSAWFTNTNAQRLGFIDVPTSRGESAHVVDHGTYYAAHVNEGLGTKNLVADAVLRETGRSFYDHIGQDTLAMIVNDLVTVGALPVSVAMHIAVESDTWFDDPKKTEGLLRGWRNACDLAGCIAGGGETATLRDIIQPGAAVLGGSAFGIIKPKADYIQAKNIRAGDVIVIFTSSGVGANGLSLCRALAKKLPQGYQTPLPNERTYGETLLDPTHIYVDVVEACMRHGVDIHYAVNITGHGWRKLMRAPHPFRYVMEHLPPSLPIFEFIRENGPVSPEEMYANFNMGAGFALYLCQAHAEKVLAIVNHGRFPFQAMIAGRVEDAAARAVVIEPMNIEFAAEELDIR